MKVVIAVATADEALLAFISANRNSVVPPEISAREYWKAKGVRFSVQLLRLEDKTRSADVGGWLRRLASAAEAVILLVDEGRRNLASEYEDAYFVADLPVYPGRVLQNQVWSTIAPILRHFEAYSKRFDELRNLRVLLLPLEIFIAAELAALRARLTAGKMAPNLAADLDRFIADLNQRSRPKTRKRFRKVYLVDDRPLWFHYGPDRHGVVETTMPPHHDKCWHNSRFRFGRLYDDRLHHNVDDDSDPTRVYGTFTTCHGDEVAANGESHLNVFPNGHL